MIIRTERANTIRDYYVDIEEICLEFNKYLLENKNQELEEKETIINKQKDKIMDMERDFEHTELEFDEFIYIATNKNYHKQNVYKIGRSARLNKRTKQFNTFFINGLKIFYIYVFQCHKSRILEQLLFTCLDKYKYCKILVNLVDYILRIFFHHCSSDHILLFLPIISNKSAAPRRFE